MDLMVRRLLVMIALLGGVGVQARDLAENFDLGFGVSVGTVGFGGSIGTSLNRELGFRVNANYLRFGIGAREPYDSVDVNIRNIGLLADFTPFFGGPFLSNIRFTAGAYVNRFFISGNASGQGLSDYVRANVGSDSPAAIISDRLVLGSRSTFEFGQSFAPYIGMGYGKFADALHKGFDLTLDVGLLFVGRAKSSHGVDFTQAGKLESTLFRNELENSVLQRVRQLESDFNDQYGGSPYPLVTVGLSYRF